MNKIFQIAILCFAIYMPTSLVQAQEASSTNTSVDVKKEKTDLVAVNGALAGVAGGIAGTQTKSGTSPLIGAGVGVFAGGATSSKKTKAVGTTRQANASAVRQAVATPQPLLSQVGQK